MTDKRIIDSFISKYHLGGNIERTKWVSDGESLKADFINDSQNLVGKVVSKKFKFPIGEFGIYSTSTLSKMLGILENEVMFDIVKEGGTPARFNIGDTAMDIKFNLADPQVIPNVPNINKTEGDIEVELTEEFTTRFIKSKDAVGEEVFYVSTQDGFTSPEVKLTIGNRSIQVYTVFTYCHFNNLIHKDSIFLFGKPYKKDNSFISFLTESSDLKTPFFIENGFTIPS